MDQFTCLGIGFKRTMSRAQVCVRQGKGRNRLPTVRALNLGTKNWILQGGIDHEGQVCRLSIYLCQWHYYSEGVSALSGILLVLCKELRFTVNDFSQPWPLPAFWPPPQLAAAAFVAPNATVVGQVEIAVGVSIWYGAILRGDVERIVIGAHTNIQDGAILHGDPGFPTIVEDYVTIGHRAVVHSAQIESGCLIGIGAVVLDGVRVGTGSIIGAGAVVTKDVPPRSLVVGVPGKVLRELSDAEVADLLDHAKKYEKLALVHANQGTDLGFV